MFWMVILNEDLLFSNAYVYTVYSKQSVETSHKHQGIYLETNNKQKTRFLFT